MAQAFAGAAAAPSVVAADHFLFGMEASTVRPQTDAGVKPDMAVFWVGPWTLTHGWGGADNTMRDLKAQGITPAIHHYYWGDDISPTCVEKGCWSSLHNSWKDQAGWNTLTTQLISHLNTNMGGEPVIIFLETEFNKGGIETYEPFDQMLADKAKQIKQGYPAAEVVLAFGNWGQNAWQNFDRAAAACDLVGVQGMRGSTRDSSTHYRDLPDTTLSAVKTLNGLFGKPIILHDIALSSYPSSTHDAMQKEVLADLMAKLPELKAAGAKAMIYRSFYDNPNFDLANYYGEAERHWGLYKYAGAPKPAAQVWIDAVKAERSGMTPTSTPTGEFSATFTPVTQSSEWWIETKVSGNQAIKTVDVAINGGAYKTMALKSWGNWAASYYAPAGSTVTFRATATDGQTSTSSPIAWGGKATAPAPQPTPEPAPTAFTASFTPVTQSNEWWIETKASGNQAIKTVDVAINGGAYKTMALKSWGNWAASYYAPAGSTVTFRATATDGQTSTSSPIAWGGKATAPAPEPTPEPLSASFQMTNTGDNAWWLEVQVSANKPVVAVRAQVNGGAWVSLDATDWGTWAKSTHVPKHSKVVFEATAADGSIATSPVLIKR